MDETAYFTDCSLVSHNSSSTFSSRTDFVPQSVIFLVEDNEKFYASKGEQLRYYFGCPYKFAAKETFDESDITDNCLIVLDKFEGPLYDFLKEKLSTRSVVFQVYGPPALIDACDNYVMENRKRPLYCNILSSLVFWVSGFQHKKELKVEMVNLVRLMGGSVTKNSGTRITHIIADSQYSEGYSYGMTFLTPVLSVRWVFDCWKNRNRPGFTIEQLRLEDYKLKMFSNLFICFIGFPRDETSHLKLLRNNEGTAVELNDTRCTHIVVHDNELKTACNFERIPVNVLIVRSEWFWLSIQQDQRVSENRFLLEPEEIIEEEICKKSSYIVNCCIPQTNTQHSDGESITLNNNESFNRNLFMKSCSTKKMHTIMELVQTEENYVNILSTILKIQEQTLDPKQPGGALLSEGEARIIFGNIRSIYEVHLLILRDLHERAENWNDTQTLIGPIFSKRTEELLDSYQPFIRYYDVSNNLLTACEKQNPRFHAFLQICKSKNECGRQNMKDLLIRPVQRLASVTLLLKDLIKSTEPDHPDYLKLKEALSNVEHVMYSINNDRKDIADRSTIFDIFNLIENCPPTLVSSQRSLVLHFEAQEVSEAHSALSKRGDYLVFYIFTDCLEICRKKKKIVATVKEGSFISDKMMKLMHGKPFKHVCLMQFSTVREIENIVCEENADQRMDCFGLTCRRNDEIREKHYFFRFIKYQQTECNKLSILTTLRKTIEKNKSGLVVQPKIKTKTAREVGLNLSHIHSGMNSVTNFAFKTKVMVESVLKNINDTILPDSNNANYDVLSPWNLAKARSYDNVSAKLLDEQEETSTLKTASYPISKR